MKIILVVGALVLVAAVGWLAMRQQKLQQRVVTLEAENKTLAETVAQQSDISPEAMAHVEARLENARAALAATEQRLTNVLAHAGPANISEVRVRETYNPCAIAKITAFLPSGQEVTVWEGVEPPATAPVDTAFAPQTRVQANSVKIYMDTRRVPGWNEIDAVELIGSDGIRQWATSATASSTYAE